MSRKPLARITTVDQEIGARGQTRFPGRHVRAMLRDRERGHFRIAERNLAYAAVRYEVDGVDVLPPGKCFGNLREPVPCRVKEHYFDAAAHSGHQLLVAGNAGVDEQDFAARLGRDRLVHSRGSIGGGLVRGGLVCRGTIGGHCVRRAGHCGGLGIGCRGRHGGLRPVDRRKRLVRLGCGSARRLGRVRSGLCGLVDNVCGKRAIENDPRLEREIPRLSNQRLARSLGLGGRLTGTLARTLRLVVFAHIAPLPAIYNKQYQFQKVTPLIANLSPL